MTIFKYTPTWFRDPTKDYYCSSVDTESAWCKIVSEVIDIWESLWHRSSNCHPGRVYCKWPLNKEWFKRHGKKGFKSWEEYMESNPKVEYSMYWDQGFYNFLKTDNTLDMAVQDDEFLIYIRLEDRWKPGTRNYENGFGVVIEKLNGSIHLVELGEDDGNWWGDHDMLREEISPYRLGLVTGLLAEMEDSDFPYYKREDLMKDLFYYDRD